MVQNSAARLFSKLVNTEIMFQSSSELFIGYPSKHELSISCQHCVTPFSLIQPQFVRLPFFVCALHLLSSAHKEQKHSEIAQ